MNISDELRNQVEELQKQPSSGVEERAQGEEGSILQSGRTVGDLIELLVELRDVLVEVWENDELARLPTGLKQSLSSQLQRALEACQQYAQNQNQAQDLETRVNQLHSFLWQNNLIDRLEKLPGYERKNKQLESLKRKGRRIVKELEEGLEEREQLSALLEEAAELKKTASEAVQEAEQTKNQLNQSQTEAQEKLNKIQTHASEAERVEQKAEETLTRAKSSADEVGARKEDVKAFVEEIETARKNLEEIEQNAKSAVKLNKEETEALVARNKELEEQVKDQLQRATGASLFKEFNKRRESLALAKWIWAGISLASLVGTVVWGVVLAGSAADPDAVFFVKLGATVPLLALVIFSLSQYGRERRAEEEYAFKSALSLSLVPYKELVEDLETDQRDAEYAKFLTKTIGQIYESPRLSSRLTTSDDELISLGAVKKVTEIVEKFVNR